MFINYYCPIQRCRVLLLLPSPCCVIQQYFPSHQVSLRLLLLEFRRWEDLWRKVLESSVKFGGKFTDSLTVFALRSFGV